VINRRIPPASCADWPRIDENTGKKAARLKLSTTDAQSITIRIPPYRYLYGLKKYNNT
jgi:hypothetical protein